MCVCGGGSLAHQVCNASIFNRRFTFVFCFECLKYSFIKVFVRLISKRISSGVNSCSDFFFNFVHCINFFMRFKFVSKFVFEWIDCLF